MALFSSKASRVGSKHFVKGESEAEVPLQTAGDYWYQPGGGHHNDSFPTGEPTILLIQWERPMGVHFYLNEQNQDSKGGVHAPLLVLISPQFGHWCAV